MHKEFFMWICAQVTLLLALRAIGDEGERQVSFSLFANFQSLSRDRQWTSLSNWTTAASSERLIRCHQWMAEWMSRHFSGQLTWVCHLTSTVCLPCVRILCVSRDSSHRAGILLAGNSRQTNCSFNDFHDNVEKKVSSSSMGDETNSSVKLLSASVNTSRLLCLESSWNFSVLRSHCWSVMLGPRGVISIFSSHPIKQHLKLGNRKSEASVKWKFHLFSQVTDKLSSLSGKSLVHEPCST